MTGQTKMKLECPFCHLKRAVTYNTHVPIEKFDCKCGAVAKVHPIGVIKQGFAWQVEWEPA